MKRFLLISILALAVPAAALAKGASEATIEGPGLDGTVVVPGNGEDGGASTLGRLAELAGFFPAVFRQTPNPMLTKKPGLTLGPRYSVRYVMPGPNPTPSIIRQYVYPYAKPFPVSYTPPGQMFWDGQKTFGGWYQSTPDLKQALSEVGLPSTPPRGGSGGFWSSTPQLIGTFGGAAAAVLAAAALALIFRRRRLQPATS
jgi:hypothetical protein